MKENNLLTFKQFIEKNKRLDRWPFTESNLRSLYRRRLSNGLEKAFVKIGCRILVDEDKFYSGTEKGFK
jgi:hypothetical protein